MLDARPGEATAENAENAELFSFDPRRKTTCAWRVELEWAEVVDAAACGHGKRQIMQKFGLCEAASPQGVSATRDNRKSGKLTWKAVRTEAR
jgi:hypothetical protein